MLRLVRTSIICATTQVSALLLGSSAARKPPRTSAFARHWVVPVDDRVTQPCQEALRHHGAAMSRRRGSSREHDAGCRGTCLRTPSTTPARAGSAFQDLVAH
jgi:hypothetical protein